MTSLRSPKPRTLNSKAVSNSRHCLLELQTQVSTPRRNSETSETLKLQNLQPSFNEEMGGCHNYGPILGPYYNTAPII